MKKINQLLKGRRNLVFLDFEGTQRTSEMIAIGAISCSLNKDGTIKKYKKPFKIYVRSLSKVGSFVVKLTGITDELLRKEAVSFSEAMTALRKYVGLLWKKSLFVTFGNNDMRILNQTISHNLKFPKEICEQIHHNYWDFATFFNNYVRDDNGNNLSLVHACEMFNIELVGKPHDPSNDAVHLAYLYNAFVSNVDLVTTRYEDVLFKNHKMPEPVLKMMEMIKEGKTVTPEDFKEAVKKDLL